jgi:hypothetical protein
MNFSYEEMLKLDYFKYDIFPKMILIDLAPKALFSRNISL